jgi:hypothetical protein
MKVQVNLRDLLWVTLVVGLALGWWLERRVYLKSEAESRRIAKDCQILVNRLHQAGVGFQGNTAQVTLYALPDNLAKVQDRAKLAERKLLLVTTQLASENRKLQWSADDSQVEIVPIPGPAASQ